MPPAASSAMPAVTTMCEAAIAPLMPAASANGTVRPSDIPMMTSRTASLATKWCSLCVRRGGRRTPTRTGGESATPPCCPTTGRLPLRGLAVTIVQGRPMPQLIDPGIPPPPTWMRSRKLPRFRIGAATPARRRAVAADLPRMGWAATRTRHLVVADVRALHAGYARRRKRERRASTSTNSSRSLIGFDTEMKRRFVCRRANAAGLERTLGRARVPAVGERPLDLRSGRRNRSRRRSEAERRYTQLRLGNRGRLRRSRRLNLSGLQRYAHRSRPRRPSSRARHARWSALGECAAGARTAFTPSWWTCATAIARKLGFDDFTYLGYARMQRIDYDRARGRALSRSGA